jgi:hypothetical protein
MPGWPSVWTAFTVNTSGIQVGPVLSRSVARDPQPSELAFHYALMVNAGKERTICAQKRLII